MNSDHDTSAFATFVDPTPNGSGIKTKDYGDIPGSGEKLPLVGFFFNGVYVEELPPPPELVLGLGTIPWWQDFKIRPVRNIEFGYLITAMEVARQPQPLAAANNILHVPVQSSALISSAGVLDNAPFAADVGVMYTASHGAVAMLNQPQTFDDIHAADTFTADVLALQAANTSYFSVTALAG